MTIRRNKLGMAVSAAVFSVALTACGGGGGGGGGTPSTENWIQDTGRVDNDHVYVAVELKPECSVAQGTLIVRGDFYDRLAAWIWNDEGNILGPDAAWPGEEFTANLVEQCVAQIHWYQPPASIEGYNVIVSNNGDGKQTGDGNVYTQDKPCLYLTSEGFGSFVAASECGVSVEGLEDKPVVDEAYIFYDGKLAASGADIAIAEIEGDDNTSSVDVALLMKGAGVSSQSEGTYWIDNDEDHAKPFVNGEVITVGKNVKVTDSTTAVLHVKYNDSVANYNIKKTHVAKDPSCRLEKQEETLGAIYSPDKTVFRIWSPDSSKVSVNVGGTDYPMKPANVKCYTSVYEVSVDGDLAGQEYQFYVNGSPVRDPYGKMIASDGTDNTANIVMDMSKTEPEGGWATAPELKNRVDSVVYEVHVRDFTIDETSGVDRDKRGRYLGMVQPGTTYKGVTTGIDHLKELGITHVQLQPIYDYGTCSDVDSQDSSCYNWGYDPWNYNVPETRYSSAFGTADYNRKINEVKTMINEFHKNGIRVIMDVVYNHTWKKSVFENITSKYYLKTDVTGCGNTVNGDENMVWTMIRDSMDYWVSEYHIDGFRLDLVGAFSINDFSDWGEYLNKAHPDANLVIYGEPWAADNDASEKQTKNPVRTGRIHMQSADAHVGVFNNRIRNCLKGSSDDGKALGFIFDKLNEGWDGNGTDENDNALAGNKECVFMGVTGGARHKDAKGTDVWTAQGYTSPEQVVSYVTAHDNLALRDKIEAAGVTHLREKQTLQGYANAIIAVSQGITFIHGGEEFGRTKAAAGKDIANTYNTTTGANDFKWDLKAGDWKEMSAAYAAFIKMRKEHPAFHMTTADDIFSNVTLDPDSTDHVVIVNINGAAVGDSWKRIKVVMNSTKESAPVNGVDDMVKVVSGPDVDNGRVEQSSYALPQSVSIWAELPLS